jgi:hypothetical protein
MTGPFDASFRHMTATCMRTNTSSSRRWAASVHNFKPAAKPSTSTAHVYLCRSSSARCRGTLRVACNSPSEQIRRKLHSDPHVPWISHLCEQACCMRCLRKEVCRVGVVLLTEKEVIVAGTRWLDLGCRRERVGGAFVRSISVFPPNNSTP